jgi:alpha-beta hydrolase superfamily lysophospholipase
MNLSKILHQDRTTDQDRPWVKGHGMPYYNVLDDQPRLAVPETDGIKPQMGHYINADGHRLQTVEFSPQSRPSGVIFVNPGLAETPRFYRWLASSIAKDLKLKVKLLVPCSQGESVRFAKDPHVVHVDSFSRYNSDTAGYMRSSPEDAGPLRLMLSHSWLGSAALTGLARQKFPVHGYVAMAPMTEATKLPWDGPEAAAHRAAARLMTRLGFGTKGLPGPDKGLDKPLGPDNDLSHNLDALRDLVGERRTHPDLMSRRQPTFGALLAYHRQADEIRTIREGSIKVPVELILGDQDTIFKNRRNIETSSVFDDCTISTVDERHAVHLAGGKVLGHILARVDHLATRICTRQADNVKGYGA